MSLQIWGVLNLTPDSFYAASRFTEKTFFSHAERMLKAGADVMDIGAESTRPFAEGISMEEEWSRLKNPLKCLKKAYGSDFLSKRVSVDTRKPEIARRSIDLGVGFINDTSGLRSEGMIRAIAESQKKVVIMHSQGNPKDMQFRPEYKEVISEVLVFLKNRSMEAVGRGILPKNIIWDPGIGFGKTKEHNLTLIKNTKAFQKEGYPLLVGLSRKSFIGKILGLDDPRDRGTGTLILHSFLALKGVDILRVHDVKETDQLRRLLGAFRD